MNLVWLFALLSSVTKVQSFALQSTDLDGPLSRTHRSSARHSATQLSATNDVTIYGHPGTRSPLVNWACLELSIDFSVATDLSANPHPFGQLPCLTDDDGSVVVFESGAILAYLQQRYGTANAATTASILSWIVWANASLDPVCFLETPDGKVYDTGLRQPNRKISRLNDLIGGRDNNDASTAAPTWLVHDGDESSFTVADVAVASYLLYVYQFFPDISLQAEWPNLPQYLLRAVRRPSYATAFGEATQARLIQQLEQDAASSGSSSAPPKKLFGMF